MWGGRKTERHSYLPIRIFFSSFGVPVECLLPFFHGLPESNSQDYCKGLARAEADADVEGPVTAASKSDGEGLAGECDVMCDEKGQAKQDPNLMREQPELKQTLMWRGQPEDLLIGDSSAGVRQEFPAGV